MSKKYIPGYQPPRHSPRLTLARLSGWACLNADGSLPWIKAMPHSKGRIVYTMNGRKFARLPWKGQPQWVKSPYKLLRQIWKIIQFQIARIDTVQTAQALLRSTRSEIIRMVKRTSPEDVEAWKKILKNVHDSLLDIGHDSVEQMRVRLQSMFGEPNFEDSIGRPLESGPMQAKMSATDRRGDEAIEDFRGIQFSMLYYFAVVKEFTHELEHNIGLMELDLTALSKKAFRGKKRYAEMRDTQAARYCINNVLETINEYMWCQPFSQYREALKQLAEPLVPLCDREAEDFDTELWQKVHDTAEQMLTIMNQIMIEVNLNHLRQHLAESVVNGEVTPQTEWCIEQIEERLVRDTENESAAYVLRELSDPMEAGTNEGLVYCYELVGNFLDPKSPLANSKVDTAASESPSA